MRWTGNWEQGRRRVRSKQRTEKCFRQLSTATQ